ncbi:hypothetical protein P691DRAFT_781501 [Macrolepiota fuliginosa MF-IS2]|uniref:Transmembrane protein n=1 Tax=Macrolepiota fuliginosa MF-IS2 TaxID=1400762 RepID=A0A9P6BWH6_9AGAR|nr:hypothetical protein P691DRAFT_781501 [Macrolepiota fuliginosa MF-IS2]
MYKRCDGRILVTFVCASRGGRRAELRKELAFLKEELHRRMGARHTGHSWLSTHAKPVQRRTHAGGESCRKPKAGSRFARKRLRRDCDEEGEEEFGQESGEGEGALREVRLVGQSRRLLKVRVEARKWRALAGASEKDSDVPMALTAPRRRDRGRNTKRRGHDLSYIKSCIAFLIHYGQAFIIACSAFSYVPPLLTSWALNHNFSTLVPYMSYLKVSYLLKRRQVQGKAYTKF